MSVNNIDKILQYILPVSKSNVIINDKVYEANVTRIQFSTSFFNIDDCYSCGKCCVPENLLLTSTEYNKLMNYTDQDFIDYGLDVTDLHELQTTIVPKTYTVNGKEITLYECPHKKKQFMLPTKRTDREVDVCYHLFKKEDGVYRCKIHPVRSITCRMPHMRIFHNKSGSTSIGISQFGRNWALGCHVTFKVPETEEQFNAIKTSKIDQLKYLNQIAEDINCETYLPEMIEYISKATFENYAQFLGKNLIPIFNSNHSLFKDII